jgi:hypothetical protein
MTETEESIAFLGTDISVVRGQQRYIKKMEMCVVPQAQFCNLPAKECIDSPQLT